MASANHFADRVVARCSELGSPIAVGLDPRPELLPPHLAATANRSRRALGRAYLEFAQLVLDGVRDEVPIVKIQIAFYEALGSQSAHVYARTVALAKERGFVVIGDVKRGDIGTTAQAYAEAHLRSFGEGLTSDVDAVTLNPYLGSDSVEPFLPFVRDHGKGLFLLVRTSNPSAVELQDELLVDGRRVFERTAELVDRWGTPYRGESGYSSVGMVAGATYPNDLLWIRRNHPHALLLVPGFGAQGGTAEGIARAFDGRGNGLIVASSREILSAVSKGGDSNAACIAAAKDAASKMRRAIRTAFDVVRAGSPR